MSQRLRCVSAVAEGRRGGGESIGSVVLIIFGIQANTSSSQIPQPRASNITLSTLWYNSAKEY